MLRCRLYEGRMIISLNTPVVNYTCPCPIVRVSCILIVWVLVLRISLCTDIYYGFSWISKRPDDLWNFSSIYLHPNIPLSIFHVFSHILYTKHYREVWLLLKMYRWWKRTSKWWTWNSQVDVVGYMCVHNIYEYLKQLN